MHPSIGWKAPAAPLSSERHAPNLCWRLMDRQCRQQRPRLDKAPRYQEGQRRLSSNRLLKRKQSKTPKHPSKREMTGSLVALLRPTVHRRAGPRPLVAYLRNGSPWSLLCAARVAAPGTVEPWPILPLVRRRASSRSGPAAAPRNRCVNP